MWLIRNNFHLKKISKHLKLKWIPLVLMLISLWDFRFEIRLMIDHFTFTGLFFAIYNHPLATAVLILMPKIYNSSPK